jgi:hypothetical protein
VINIVVKGREKMKKQHDAILFSLSEH